MKSVNTNTTRQNKGLKRALAFGLTVSLLLMSLANNAMAQSDRDQRDSYQSERDRYEQQSERYDSRDDRREARRDDRDRYDDRYDDRRKERRRPSYRYCQERAEDITGYRGPRPSRYRGGNALEGAIKGGINAGTTSWALGGDKKQIRKARERGAKLGFIIGAIKSGAEREKQRRYDQLRRDYDYEVRQCMRDY